MNFRFRTLTLTHINFKLCRVVQKDCFLQTTKMSHNFEICCQTLSLILISQSTFWGSINPISCFIGTVNCLMPMQTLFQYCHNTYYLFINLFILLFVHLAVHSFHDFKLNKYMYNICEHQLSLQTALKALS